MAAATCIIHDQRLKGELQVLRRKGALCASGGGGRSCSRCRGELGRIINRGACCPSCRQRVCKSCREYTRPNPTQWLCTLCHKHMELRAATGDWMNDFVCASGKGKDSGMNATETIKRSLQRSWTFSDTSPSPWCYLRGSPEMRAYSSMPRHHQDCDFLGVFVPPPPHASQEPSPVLPPARPPPLQEDTKPSSEEGSGGDTLVDSSKNDSDLELNQSVANTPAELSSLESSPSVDKRSFHDILEPITGPIFRRVVLRDRSSLDARNLPPGVTPPRSRRGLQGSRPPHQEHQDGLHHFLDSSKCLLPESDDYKLVFISSDSSSREELHSEDDGSSTTSSPGHRPSSSNLEDCDWDYFEYCVPAKPEKKQEWPWAGGGVGERESSGGGSGKKVGVSLAGELPGCASCSLPLHVPIPVPVPVPVPFFLPLPWNHSLLYPLLQARLRDDGSSYAAMSSAPRQSESSSSDGVVLKLYRPLESGLGEPPDVLPPDGSRQSSSSSCSCSSDEGNPRTGSFRVYKLARDEEDNSEDSDSSLGGTPPGSSSSSSGDEESAVFCRTFVVNRTQSDGESMDEDQEEEEDSNRKKSAWAADLPWLDPDSEDNSEVVLTGIARPESPRDGVLLLSRVELEETTRQNDPASPEDRTAPSSLSPSPDNQDITTPVLEDVTSSQEVIHSIITFSHVEILQIVSEFLRAERLCFETAVTMITGDKNAAAASESRSSNTSDEFSGTESMEMPLEDTRECPSTPTTTSSQETVTPGVENKERYTSLVMITQERGASPDPPQNRGAPPPPAPLCLEEGLADDDSWVEELDREEAATTTEESSEEECFPDREEELRGYHRSAIDFTLHTIVEESCEESEVEVEKTHHTELEKYFVFGLGQLAHEDEERELDTLSETSSVFSEGLESVAGTQHDSDNNGDPAETASSRLEKYFLNGFKDFRRRDSDGSVGSDSEGKPSPEQRKKRLVRARGTARQHSSSLDNLAESDHQAEVQSGSSTEGSTTETDSHDDQSNSFDKNDGQFDTVKRTKKKKRSVSSAPSVELLEQPEDASTPAQQTKEDNNSDEGGSKKTHQSECLASNSDLSSSRNKHQSRDSGFMGSSDDLLKDSRDSPGNESSKNDEDSSSSALDKTRPDKIVPEVTLSSPPLAGLTRKDSFNNWSSDEETNLMMSKMRAFFKTMGGGAQVKGTSPNVRHKTKPPQLLYFETELTRLMKTVPGLKDEQVKEIVEYLSSEDTWSDSYDSSDYTSSDLEGGNKKTALQEEISASCRQIIDNFDSSQVVEDEGGRALPEGSAKDSVYQRIVASFSKIEPPLTAAHNSPPLIEKVMQHIGTRLVALMHQVSSGEGTSPRTQPKHHRRIHSKLSATSTTEEEEDSTAEDYGPLPRSKSHDPLLEENRQETSDNERFSWRGSFESALMASTDSRTRLASSGGEGSASALALAAKRRSAGDLMFKTCSREQLDRVRSCGSIGGSIEDKIWAQQRAQRARRSSDSGGSAEGDDDSEEDTARATLPRLITPLAGAATNSLPRLPTSCPQPTIYKAHSVHNVKSARYRPPGYRGPALPPRRDNRRRVTPSPTSPNVSSHSVVCDDASVCSEPVGRAVEDEVVERLHRVSLGARSDSLASVYSGAGEGRHGGVPVRGEVQFGLQYNYKQSSLEIHVKQCKDLAPVDLKRNRSDPYVKVYLLPDKSKSGKRKTRVKKHTLNPIFEETLRFQMSLDGLENRTLWLSVWHSDMFGRNDFLGEVLMPLENKIFDDPVPKFYTLQERSEPLEELNSKGELIVGLKFVPPEGSNGGGSKKRGPPPTKGHLMVLVKEAKNLPPVKSNGTSDPFCKSYLLPDKGRGSKQKAPVVRRTCNPAWNHTFVYNNLTLSELHDRSLELTIWDHDRLASNEFLGGVRLNLGTGKHNSKVVDWMDSSGNETTLWQRMLERPNFWVESCLPLRPSLDVRKNSQL